MCRSISLILTCLACPGMVSAEILLATNFDGRSLATTTSNNDTAGGLVWTTNGIEDPGALTAVPDEMRNNGFGQFEANGLFTTAPAANAFVPNLNIHNEGTYFVDVPLVTIAQLRIDSVSILAQIHNNAGALQGVGREVDYEVAILDEADQVIADDVTSGQNALTHNGDPAPTMVEFDLGGATLPSGGVYRLRIRVGADTTLVGNNAGFDDLEIRGAAGEGARFAITSIAVDLPNDQATIVWSSIPGRTYAVDASGDLEFWDELDDSVLATGDTTEFTDSGLPPGERFYRVRPGE